ncbi:hypothetical protein HPB51_014287 [Rhipicephalus microplus]|uniref:THIF-type NAD/FAD binding fold domain-containing protein n=1 Tax=Rhipicephalus microplus TaxID=6941 RepID=A0A9J6DVR1_RHIMP|nr:hypothetical protein HPB51_014287 [Rhipicephalus microplus]
MALSYRCTYKQQLSEDILDGAVPLLFGSLLLRLCLSTRGTVGSLSWIVTDYSRYCAQTSVFGHEVQQQLLRQRFFVVGAEAIGCELLKNIAMMGVGAFDGCIYVTDSDKVQRSNLNRQFLFRAEDVGVGPETEKMYDDRFFECLNGVVLALDDVEGREYNRLITVRKLQ